MPLRPADLSGSARTVEGYIWTQEDCVIAAPQIEEATPNDLDAIARMRVEMGWHRSDPLLASVLEWQRGRIFVIRSGSLGTQEREFGDPQRIMATTSAIAAGPVGVIGNVGVRTESRRLGLGRIIMSHAIEWQRRQGVQTSWLDATTAGRGLYRKLGYGDVTSSWVVHTKMRDIDVGRLEALADGYLIREARPDQLATIATLDAAAFGGNRLGLLEALARQPDSALYFSYRANDDTGQPDGYALTRRFEEPYTGVRVGPMIATNDGAAAALTLSTVRAERERYGSLVESGVSYFNAGGGDMPAARAFFAHIAAPPVDDDLVMRLDLQPTAHGAPQAAPLDPEQPLVYSWSSSMLF